MELLKLTGITFFWLAFIAVMVFFYAPKLAERLEYQAEAEMKYNCKKYGYAMNKFYQSDVCEVAGIYN